jgi:hypothetical protein
MMKKGQTATEYLIILAVVIVIALIVVGVLGGIPSIGGGAKDNSLSAYWATSKVGVNSISVANADGDVTVVLRNNLPNTIDVTSVELVMANGTYLENTTSYTLAAGRTQSVLVQGDGAIGSGTTFSYTPEFNYTDSETSGTFSFDGDGNKLEGTVSN